MSGSLNHTPALILQQWLIDTTIAGGKIHSATWPAYTGQLPDTPNDAIAVYDTSPIIQARVAIGTTIQQYGNQFSIRTDNEDDGEAKAIEILDALDAVIRTSVTLTDLTGTGSTTYKIQAIHHEGVLYLGPEIDSSTRRRLYTINTLADINVS